MSDKEISVNPQDGGKRRKNGHKMICKCPICVNMKHAKRGGDIDDISSSDEEDIESNLVGGKKKNGHKMMCKCPICKNMKMSKRGGDIYDEGESSSNEDDTYYDNEGESSSDEEDLTSLMGGKKKNGHKMMCKCPICKNMKISKNNEEDPAAIGFNISGGKKKNGHKMMCKCPICKNMKMSKRGGGDTDANNVKINYETSQGQYDLYDSNRYKGGSKKSKGKRKSKKNSKGGKRRKSRKTRRNKRRSNRK